MPTIYDSTNIDDIPSYADYLLAYIDGHYANYREARAKFPHARILTVTTSGDSAADICDVENGDATPHIAAQGVLAGLYETIYTSKANVPNVVAAMAAVGSPRWRLFDADWTGHPHVNPGSVATQYASPSVPGQVPGHYDMSLSLPAYPPLPIPSQPNERQLMQAITNTKGETVVYASSPANHLLEFTKVSSDPDKWSVIDVTALIGNVDAGEPFLVQS